MLLPAIVLLLFMLAGAVVALRLLRLWRITHLLPELLLAITLLCTGLVGFAMEKVVSFTPATAGQLRPTLAMAGLGGEYAGAVALVVFAWRVFRPRARWAAMLAGALFASLAVALSAEIASGQFLHYVDQEPAVGPIVPFGIAVRGLAPLWVCLESFRQHWRLTHRRKRGSTEPFLVHRVGLWASATGAAAAAHAVAVAHRAVFGTGLQAHPWAMDVVSGLALVSAVSVGLAFFPPHAYRRWIRGTG